MTQDNDPWGNNPRNTDGNDFGSILQGLKDSLFGNDNNKKNNSQKPHNSGGGNNENNNGNNGNIMPNMPNFSKKAILPVAAVALLGWGATGIYILPEGFHGVELVFGKYHETATQPGFNTRWPYPIGSVTKVDIGSIKNLTVGGQNDTEGQMLTADENIVEVSLSVQYKIGEAEKFLFNVNEPETVLRETLISSIREVVGGSTVDYVLTDGRAEWPARVREGLVKTLKGFDVGFDILRVELRDAKAPAAVQAAFDDAVKAREDAERYKLQAEAYQNEKVPLARGRAKEILAHANAYKASVVAKATGEAQRFEDVLKSYKLAPQITRDRLYIETMQDIYSNVNNIVVATGKDAPTMYLPMGQVTGQTAGQNTTAPLPIPKNKSVQSNEQSFVQPMRAKIPQYELQQDITNENININTKAMNKRLTR